VILSKDGLSCSLSVSDLTLRSGSNPVFETMTLKGSATSQKLKVLRAMRVQEMKYFLATI
jgi:hypothetical protein